jgi:hypothetical protein
MVKRTLIFTRKRCASMASRGLDRRPCARLLPGGLARA